MSEVKRYEGYVHGSGGDYWVEMEESRNGQFVSLADYEQLRQKLEAELRPNSIYQVVHAATGQENWNAQCGSGHLWHSKTSTDSCPVCTPKPEGD